MQSPGSREYYVDIMASWSRALYIGMTNNLERRVRQHKDGQGATFTAQYRIHRPVYFETTNHVHIAIEREKHLKGWRRSRKIDLIESVNQNWIDLAENW